MAYQLTARVYPAHEPVRLVFEPVFPVKVDPQARYEASVHAFSGLKRYKRPANPQAEALLTGRHPGVPRGLEKAAALCGSISTGIYLIHITVRDGYQAFFQWRLEPHMGASEPWLQPLIILFVSLASAALWKCLVSCCSCLFVQRKKE